MINIIATNANNTLLGNLLIPKVYNNLLVVVKDVLYNINVNT